MEIIVNAFLADEIDYETMMAELYEYKLRGDNKSYPLCSNTEDNEEILPF